MESHDNKDTKIKKGDIFFLVIIIIGIFLFALNIKGVTNHEEIPHYLILGTIDLDKTNLLSPYGKPSFTIIIYIFYLLFGESMGFNSIRFGTALLSSLSLIYTYKISKTLLDSRPQVLCATSLTFFSNYFLLYSGACLSEVGALAFFMVAYYYHLKERYNLSAIIFSLSFLARNEMIFIISVLGLKHLKYRRLLPIIIYASLPILWLLLIFLTGNDGLEVISYNNFNESPTTVIFSVSIIAAISNYSTVIFRLVGYPIAILAIIGTFYSYKKKKNSELFLLIFAYIGCQLLFLIVNILGSGGSIRYFYILIPFISIISAQGLNYINLNIEIYFWKRIEKKKKLNQNLHKIPKNYLNKIFNLSFIVFLLLNVYDFTKKEVPFSLTPQQIIENETGIYLSNKYDLKEKKVYCPFIGVTFILSYFYSPTVYFLKEWERHDSIQEEIRYNYTFLEFDGFFGEQHYDANILDEIEDNSLVIWEKKSYNNSILNPIHLNDARFKEIVVNEYLIVYEVNY